MSSFLILTNSACYGKGAWGSNGGARGSNDGAGESTSEHRGSMGKHEGAQREQMTEIGHSARAKWLHP